MQPSSEGIAGVRPPGIYPIPDEVGKGLDSSYAFHPVDGNFPKHLLRVSKSSMNTFQFCEQQYFIKYILGVKEVENDNMRRGTNVHDAMEDFYNAVDLDFADMFRDKPNDLYTYFKGFIPSSSKEKEYKGVVTPSSPYTLGEREHLERMMMIETNRFLSSDKENFLPVINEDEVNAVVDIEVDGKVVMVHLTGIIDRAFTDADGNLHIHELKTGLWKHSDYKLESMRKEMAFYVYLLRKSKGHKFSGKTAAYWGWDHTKGDTHGKEIYRFVENVRTDAIQEVLRDLKSLIRMHLRYTGNNNGWMFPLKPNGFATTRLCEPWCAVKGFCPKYGRVLMPHDMKKEMEA
tara:strand:+ start:4017 stop:5054 length:1038 start_codon:yes stop_codon:yes gene_type:complete